MENLIELYKLVLKYKYSAGVVIGTYDVVLDDAHRSRCPRINCFLFDLEKNTKKYYERVRMHYE